MPDGKWQALHADKIWASNTVIGSIYHAYLRAGMEKLGYKVELQGKHGTFEITGVPKAVLEAYSQRRADILATAEKLGIKSTQGLRDVTTRTRDPKLNVEDREGLMKAWLDKAEALGFNGKDVLAAAERQVQARENSTPLERGYQAVVEAVKSAREFVAGLLRSPDPLVDKGIARIAKTPAEAGAQLAVASAIRIHGQREAAFDVDRLAKTGAGSRRSRRHHRPGRGPHRAACRARAAHPRRDPCRRQDGSGGNHARGTRHWRSASFRVSKPATARRPRSSRHPRRPIACRPPPVMNSTRASSPPPP